MHYCAAAANLESLYSLYAGELSAFAYAEMERMSDADVDRESVIMPFTDSELADAFRNDGGGACAREGAATSPGRRDTGDNVGVTERLSDRSVDIFAIENNPSSFVISDARAFVICDHCVRTQFMVARISSAATRTCEEKSSLPPPAPPATLILLSAA